MPQNNFWGCKLPDFHLLTGKTPFLRLLEKIQSPYTLLAAFPRTWYNREESLLGQLEFFSGCSFLIALNMILHLRIIPYRCEQRKSLSCFLKRACRVIRLFFHDLNIIQTEGYESRPSDWEN